MQVSASHHDPELRCCGRERLPVVGKPGQEVGGLTTLLEFSQQTVKMLTSFVVAARS